MVWQLRNVGDYWVIGDKVRKKIVFSIWDIAENANERWNEFLKVGVSKENWQRWPFDVNPSYFQIPSDVSDERPYNLVLNRKGLRRHIHSRKRSSKGSRILSLPASFEDFQLIGTYALERFPYLSKDLSKMSSRNSKKYRSNINWWPVENRIRNYFFGCYATALRNLTGLTVVPDQRSINVLLESITPLTKY